MALTRAQLLAGNSSQGTVLSGQVQGVTAGSGVQISATGVLSLNAADATFNGFIKTNNNLAYNAYVWPGVDGTANQFLQTDGSGNLTWADARGFSVVTVSSIAPTPVDVGELWYDCSTGTLKVYQNCNQPFGWKDVSQSGLPVDPALTIGNPVFTVGTGTQGNPYQSTVTTAGAGTTVYVVNSVTISGLAPFQYVPIVDMSAAANGGRFSFTNYYANSVGTLYFQTIFTDAPVSAPGTTYTANIRVGYNTAYIDSTVNVVTPLSISAVSIPGSPVVGTSVTYTGGVASNGAPGYTYAYQWYADGVAIGGATSSSFNPTPTEFGKTLSVTVTATDTTGVSVSSTGSASVATGYSPFPSGVWNPTPAGGLNEIPGLISGTYTGLGATITATGCIEVSTDGTNFSQSEPILTGSTLYARWIVNPACGDASTGTNLTGDITDGNYLNSYAVTVNRKPNPALANVSDTGIALGATTTKSLAAAVAGLTATAYITLDASSTGTTVQVSTDNGTTFQTVPAAPSTLIPVNNGVTLQIRQTVGSTVSTGYIAAINIGDSTGSTGAASTYQTVTYTATTVATAAFPGVTFTPAGPNAAPETVSAVAGGGTLGTLNGTANSNAWPAGLGTTLSSPGGTPTMKFRVNSGGAFVTSGLAIVPTDILNLAWNEAYLDTVTTGNTATGTFQGTVGATTYTNTYTMVVERAANFTTTSGAASGASGTISLVSQTPDQYNVPVKLYQTVPGSNALTSVTVDINSAGPVALPTSLATALTLNPGDSVVFSATAPGTPATYTTQIHIGDTVNTWSYQVTVTPTVSTPAINNPTSGTTVDPTANTPSGITVTTPASGTTGGFQTNYAGTQTAADWYVYKALLTQPETSAITNVTTVNWDSSITISPGPTVLPISNIFTLNSNYDAPVGSTIIWTVPSGLTGPLTVSAPNENYCWRIDGGAWNTAGRNQTNYLINADVSSFTTLELMRYDGGVGPGTVSTVVPAEITFANQNPLSGPWAFKVNGQYLLNSTTLTLTDSTNLANMTAGDSIVEINSGGGAGDASGTIGSINVAGPTIDLSSSTGTWTIGSTVQDTTASPVVPPAPPALPPTVPDPTKYTAVTGFPLNVTAAPFNQAFIAEADLAVSSTYYASVIYTGSGSVVSTASAWSDFDTVASFLPAIGAAYGGGYFAGQINDGGTIYNLVVAPRQSGSLFGQNGGNAATFPGSGLAWGAGTNDTTANNDVYGAPATVAYANASFPAFNWIVNNGTGPNAGTYDATNATGTGIGGYNDWYLPARYELEVLYYYLKPTTTVNNIASGANPYAVSPEPVNTAYTGGPAPATGPAQTTASAFQVGGGEAFVSNNGYYRSATQNSGAVLNAYYQLFDDGSMGSAGKGTTYLVRAIRRVAA